MGLIGELCIDERNLNSVARKRRREYIEKTVKHSYVKAIEKEGWIEKRRNKKTSRVRKRKTHDEKI
jgi:DNA-binding MarR family transcriptional regulator